MHIPGSLAAWNYDRILELAKQGRCEGERHDFKYNLPDAHNLTKLCCSFANSQGGFIIVGVKERSGHFLVEGISPDIEIAKKFGDKLNVIPTIEYSSPVLINCPSSADKVLYVFEVPASLIRPHIPSEADKRVFWKRTPAGCEQMTYNEIQEQFLRTEERREKLKLLYIELLLNNEALVGMSRVLNNHYSLVTLDKNVLDRLLVDTYSVVQGQTELLRILLTLRSEIAIINNKSKIFFSQMALPLANNAQIVAEQNDFIKQKATALLPLIKQALEILGTQFHLKNPLVNT